MQTFSYKGYDFDVDHTPTAAEFAQMSAHVDSLPPKEVGKEPSGSLPKADWGTAGKQAVANFLNTTDKAGALLGGGVLSAVGATDMAGDMYAKMQRDVVERNKWANPANQEIGFGGKLLNVVPGILSSGLGPAETGMTLLDADESLGTAFKGAAVDAAGNAVGMILPGYKQGGALVRGATGFGANAAQDVITKKAIQSLAETEKGKASFQWTPEDAAVAGVTGGVFATVAGKSGVTKPSKLDLIKEQQDAIDALNKPAELSQAKKTEPLTEEAQLKQTKAEYEENLAIEQEVQQRKLEMAAQKAREERLASESGFNPDAKPVYKTYPLPEEINGLTKQSPMERAASDLGAPKVEPEAPRTAMSDMATRLEKDSTQEARSAQDALEQRQSAMEQEMAQRATLEGNARLRQQQEGAPTMSPEMLKVEQERQAHADQVAQEQAHQQQIAKEHSDAMAEQQRIAEAQAAIEARQKALEGSMAGVGDTVRRNMALQAMAEAQRSLAEKSPYSPAHNAFVAKKEAIRLAKEKADTIAARRAENEAAIQSLRDKHEASQARQTEAQRQLDLRTEQQRLDAQTQHNLAFNAAERARQEAGAIPPEVGPLKPPMLGSKARKAMRGGRGSRGKQGGKIDLNLIGAGKVADMVNLIRKTVKDRPLAKILEKFKGTFEERSLVSAYNKSVDPKAFEHVVMMSPKEFRALAMDRGSQAWTNLDSQMRRERVAAGLDTKEGLNGVPWLEVDENGKVTGHDGRHRADMLDANRLEAYPVIIKHPDVPNSKFGHKSLTGQDLTFGGRRVRENKTTFSLDNESTKPGPQDNNITNGKFDSSATDKPIVDAYKRLLKAHSSLTIAENPFAKTAIKQEQTKARNAFEKAVAQAGLDLKATTNSLAEMHGEVGARKFDPLGHPEGGAIGFGKRVNKELPALENASDLADEALIPKNPIADEVVKQALTEGKDGKFLTYLQSGATSTAMKTGSSAIKAAAEIIQNAGKRSELAIRNIVFPAEKSLRKLKTSELIELQSIFKDEMFSNRRFDADILSSHLSVKQLESYVNMREMFDKALDAQNAERVSKDMKPITAKEAYMSSRWRGAFRRPIHDSKGNLVWYLAADSTSGLEKQTKSLLAEFPELSFDPKNDHQVSSSQSKTELQSAYTKMLDILDRNDPAIQKMQKAIEEQTVAEGYTTRGQSKHFERKSNVRGFVGDRPGTSPKSEAIAMFSEQLQYAKNALTWSEMQVAANDIKGIISNPDLKLQQPNNVKYIREYFKNAIGHSEAKAVRNLSDSIQEGLGVSPAVFDRAIGDVKSFFILQKLAASAGFTAANVIQTTNVIPYLMDLRAQGYKGNPITSIAVGIPSGMIMMFSHYLKAGGGEYVDLLPNQFLKDAARYAEANSVTSRSIYDESPLATGFSPIKGAVNIASKTMTIPETFVRSVAFTTYAQMLKDSGKYTDQSKLFQHAEELVNASMVDYRASERPLAFAKAGTMGNFLNTLQTYPMSFYNQYGYMARQASNGNIVPLMSMMALQAAVGGAMALPYADDLYKLFTHAKNNWVSDAMWKDMQDSPFLSDPKLWMMETLGKGSVYGYVSDKTGLGLTSRISAPSLGGMLQSPVGPITDIAGQVGAVGSALADPTNSTKWAQAGMKVVPVGLAGLLESSDAMKDHTYTTRKDGSRVYVKTNDLAARRATIKRSPEEDAVRKWGLRSQREVVEKDVQYITSQQNKAVRDRIGSSGSGTGELMEKFYDAKRRGDKESAKKLATLYVQLSGKEINQEMVNRQIIQERMTSLERLKKNMDKMSPQEIVNNARMIAILKDNK